MCFIYDLCFVFSVLVHIPFMIWNEAEVYHHPNSEITVGWGLRGNIAQKPHRTNTALEIFWVFFYVNFKKMWGCFFFLNKCYAIVVRTEKWIFRLSHVTFEWFFFFNGDIWHVKPFLLMYCHKSHVHPLTMVLSTWVPLNLVLFVHVQNVVSYCKAITCFDGSIQKHNSKTFIPRLCFEIQCYCKKSGRNTYASLRVSYSL